MVINTFTQRRTERRRSPGLYASYVVARLAEHGWPAVDRMLAHMHACGARDSALLEPLAAVDRLLPSLLSSQAPTDRSWRHWPMAIEYVRRHLVQDLGGLAGVDVPLQSLAGTPAQRLILELVAAEGAACRPAIDFLLQSLPLDWVAEVVGYPSVSPSDKADLLARYAAHRGDLPAGSDWIWDQADKMLIGYGKPAETLLIHVLARLEPPALERFYQGTASSRADIFLPCVVQMCRLHGGRWEPLTRLLAKVDDTALLALYHRRGAPFFAQYPDAEPALPQRLCHIGRTLTAHPMSFVPRLEIILAAQENLGDEGERQRALAWNRCRKAFHEIARLARERSGTWRRQSTADLEAACRALADAAAEAIPPEAFPNDRTGAEREKFSAPTQRLGGARRTAVSKFLPRAGSPVAKGAPTPGPGSVAGHAAEGDAFRGQERRVRPMVLGGGRDGGGARTGHRRNPGPVPDRSRPKHQRFTLSSKPERHASTDDCLAERCYQAS